MLEFDDDSNQKECQHCGKPESSWENKSGYFCSFGCMMRYILSPGASSIIWAIAAIIAAIGVMTTILMIFYLIVSFISPLI